MTAPGYLLPFAAEGDIQSRAQIAAVIVTVLLLGLVLELVRRRRLVERYALLWMSVAVVLLLLAVWTDLLDWTADRVGIADPSNALFLAAFGVAFVLLLHFSVATSRLGEESKILAQEVARLDEQLRRLGAPGANGTPQARDGGGGSSADADERAAPSSGRTSDQ
ncbi:MAG TPA: DUF2304 domain-containing protein [Solirubrobacterales bacterium]|nr:DUF2304 domain-containing protein [Solirubrobacterales bacterium]